MAVGVLYLVATPIGNLSDLSPRAREVLASVDLVAGESEAGTRRLLSALAIRKPVMRYQEQNRRAASQRALRELGEGRSLALVSDAGTPGIADPGRELVDCCHREGIPVRSVPGPSALTAALSVSGLPARRVAFEGFLPRHRSERRACLEGLKRESRTLVFFEAPHRLRESLEDLLEVFGDREVCLARELSKVHEQVLRAPLSGLLAGALQERGECCLVVAPPEDVPEAPPDLTPQATRLHELGLSPRTAAEVLELFTSLSRKQAYRLCLQVSGRA